MSWPPPALVLAGGRKWEGAVRLSPRERKQCHLRRECRSAARGARSATRGNEPDVSVSAVGERAGAAGGTEACGWDGRQVGERRTPTSPESHRDWGDGGPSEEGGGHRAASSARGGLGTVPSQAALAPSLSPAARASQPVSFSLSHGPESGHTFSLETSESSLSLSAAPSSSPTGTGDPAGVPGRLPSPMQASAPAATPETLLHVDEPREPLQR